MHRLSGRMGHVCVEGLGPRCAQTVRACGACLCRGFRSYVCTECQGVWGMSV